MRLERLPVFFRLSRRNSRIKGQLDYVPDAMVITIYTKNIESIEDVAQTIAHEALHILCPEWDDEKVEQESVNFSKSEEFKAWLKKKMQEYESLASLFRSMIQ